MTRQPESPTPRQAGLESKSPVPPLETVEEAIAKVFISPRVVDQRAFEEFATQLREMMKGAAAQERSLRAAGAEIKVVEEQLRAATKALRTELEARDRSPAPAREGPRVEAINPGGPGRTEPVRTPDEIEVRARAAREALEAAADEAVVRVAALVRQVEAAEHRVVSQVAAAGAACDRTADLTTELDIRITRAGQAAREAREESDSKIGEAGARLGAALGEAERRAQTLTTGLEAALVDFERRARLIQERLEQDTPQPQAPSSPGVNELRELLGEAHRVGDALSRLVARADAVGQALDRLTRESPAAASRGTAD